ncbi:unnamed protein product [Parnassius mnemosyne]|uniref:Uncharacterized protein n=1 Tax=Parnassius mnemosyne TaxID=213953 RepID=A0AAV1L4P0_9NEOP
MLSSSDLERLITEKKLEIEKEKIALGLMPSLPHNNVEENKGNNTRTERIVNFLNGVLPERPVKPNEKLQENQQRTFTEFDEEIPPDLERYIRRCTGLPVMLKAGEYSPNNPLIRGERTTGDALLGLGEYERRRNTLRKLRQQQYREYLDQQAKLKQEAKEKAERERREREEKERAQEEEKEQERRQLEQENHSPIRRRASWNYGQDVSNGSSDTFRTKVDTGVQVNSLGRPLSVAVQTDDVELYAVPSNQQKLTQAERELSPRLAGEQKWTEDNWSQWKMQERRRSYGDFDERSASVVKKYNKDKLTADLRHSYMPSIFDAEAIQMRNLQAEKEAAERRQFYQQELKNQIMEQQRIREERKTREKMLEQAEMRRLEEQLRALKVAQQHETYRQINADESLREHATEYEKKRNALQKEIDEEKKTLMRATSQYQPFSRKIIQTSHSDKNPSKLPLYNQNKTNPQTKPPYSINIPDNSIFSKNYDVESYLRKNLNPSRESLMSNNLHKEAQNKVQMEDTNKNLTDYVKNDERNRNFKVEKALIHTQPKEKRDTKTDKEDTLPIPVLRHSPINIAKDINENTELSEAMQMVDCKWKVPAVQRNILKSLPNEEGKNVNILTQLGSIRRQLQLEQLKLDNMVPKDDGV